MRFGEACLWIGIPLALLVAWLLIFCIPMVSQIEGKKGELAGVEARIAGIERQLSQTGRAAPESVSRAVPRNPPDQIPHLEAFPGFVKKIAASARKGGVTIDRLKGRIDDANVKAGPVLAYPVTEMEFTGPFMNIGRVLEEIQKVQAYRRIVRAQLVAPENIHPHIKGTVVIEFSAWKD